MTTPSELKELQTIWDNAVEAIGDIPQYNHKHLIEITKAIPLTSTLRSAFEQLLQNYLTNNNNNNSNVFVLLDIAITISLSASSASSASGSSSSAVIDDKLYFFVINLLDTFCEYLSCDKLEIVVLYLTKRSKILCKLSQQWQLKFKANNKSTNNLELPILKFCNKLLFRLNDIAKRGEFLVFMSCFVDIDSRSGQNFLGQFHLENITKTDDESVSLIDNKLYKALWSLQDVFNDPRWIGKKFNAERFANFRDNLDLVLQCFKKNKISMDEAMGHFKTAHNKSGKYLTSFRLFNKQLYNPSFRRYILVQSLIFLSSHCVDVPSEHPKLTPFNTFAPKEKQWIQNKYVEITCDILPSIQPHGDAFTKFITNILSRDENWLIWKYNKKDSRCNKLKRRANINTRVEPLKKKRKIDMNTYTLPMGNTNLRDVFKWTPAVFQSKRNDVELNQDAKGLGFLSDYRLIDFKRKLNNRLDYLLQQQQNQSDTHLLFNNEQTVFSNLRIMRDLHHDMFAELCPMANNPEPKTFKCQFLLDALKYHSPKTFANESNGYHSRKYSRSKPKTANTKR